MGVMRSALLAVSKMPLVKKVVLAFPPTRQMVRRFVPGEDLAEVLAAIEPLLAQGMTVTIDVLGEDTTTESQARRNTDDYLALFAAIAERGLGERVEASLKLSAVGQFLPGGESIAVAHAREICAAAADAGSTLTLDMESHTTTDSTLRILRLLRADYPWVGCVLQTYLHRTPEDAAALDGPGSRVRLCKGAYAEPDEVAHQEAGDVDAAYIDVMAQLLAGEGYPMLATHDPRLIAIAQKVSESLGRTADDFEFQMLYGVRPQAQQELLSEGYRMRVYVPFGRDWYGYYIRRLAERPANVIFFLRSLVPGNH